MFQRLHASPSSQGYKQLSNDALTHSALSPELSGQGVHVDGVPALSRSNTYAGAKSYGDLKVLSGRSRGKKTRAIKWLVLRATGERQIFTLDKRQLIQTCRLEIPIRDMRLMDAALGTETLAQLLVRDNALVFSMEHVRMIIMADKVVVPLDDSSSQQPPPPPAPPQTPTPERPTGPSSEVKDRFISHLEGVVMDWALQHSCGLPTPVHVSAGTASNGGGNAAAAAAAAAGSHQLGAPFGAHPPVSAAAIVAGGQGGGAGGPNGPGGGSIAAQLEAHIAARGTAGTSLRAVPSMPGFGAAAAGAGAAAHLGAGLMGSVGGGGGGGGGGGPGSETASQTAFDPEYQPFEMLVLETALSEICSHLSREVDCLQVHCQPALEALMKNADTANLEAVRRVKTQHSRLVTRVTASREALQRLMEDDDDMVRMCLTQQALMRVAAVAAAAAAAQQQQQQQQQQQLQSFLGHHGHVSSFASLVGGANGGGNGGVAVTPPATATATPAAAVGAAVTPPPPPPQQPGPCHSPPDSSYSPSHADAHHLAMLMGSSLSAASYMRPASLAARAVRHQVAKKTGGSLGEALAEAAAAAAVAAAAVTPGGPGSGGGGGGGGGGGAGGAGSELGEHDFLDVEALLESYAIIVDTTYQTLMSIGEYIDDTEDLINIQLDFSRNKLIRFELLLTTGTFALAFFNIVTGILGENLVLPDTITQDLYGFVLVNGGTLMFCISCFLALFMLFKWSKVL